MLVWSQWVFVCVCVRVWVCILSGGGCVCVNGKVGGGRGGSMYVCGCLFVRVKIKEYRCCSTCRSLLLIPSNASFSPSFHILSSSTWPPPSLLIHPTVNDQCSSIIKPVSDKARTFTRVGSPTAALTAALGLSIASRLPMSRRSTQGTAAPSGKTAPSFLGTTAPSTTPALSQWQDAPPDSPGATAPPTTLSLQATHF